jgi:hypothetical protein
MGCGNATSHKDIRIGKGPMVMIECPAKEETQKKNDEVAANIQTCKRE